MVLFFVPLPEPMVVPNEWTRPIIGHLGADEYMRIASEAGTTGYLAELLISLRFRRVQRRTDVAATLIDMRPAMVAGLPGLPHAPDLGESVDTVHTVVEVADTVSAVTQDELTRVVDEALEAIRRVQRAYGGATGRAPVPVSRSHLPPVMPIFVFEPATPFERRHENPVVFLPSVRSMPVTADVPTLTDETIQALDHLHGELDGRSPFRVGEQLLQEARRFVDDDDDPRSSIAAIATACEVIVDDLLACLLWEEGKRPEQCSRLFEPQLTKRLRAGHFQSRLAGDWDVDSDGPIGAWIRRVARRRNRMLHTGEESTLGDARDAFEVALELIEFMRNELLDAVERHPRTTWMMLGMRQVPVTVKDQHIEPLLADQTETAWASTAAHGIRVMCYARKHGEWTRPAKPEDVALIGVVHPDRQFVWVAMDERLERGLLIDDPSPWLSEEQRQSVGQTPTPDEPFSIRMGRPPGHPTWDPPMSVDGDWIAGYRLIPGRPAMVTGDALDYVVSTER